MVAAHPSTADIPPGAGPRVLSRLLRPYLRSHHPTLAGFVCCQLILAGTMLAQPTLNAQIIDNGVLRGDIDQITRLGLLMLAIAAVNLTAGLASAYLMSRIGAGIARDLRRSVHERLSEFGEAETGRFGVATLLNRITGDVGTIQTFVGSASATLLLSPLLIVGAVIAALTQSWHFAILILLAGLMLGGVVSLLIRRLLPWARRLQRSLDDVGGTLREQLSGVRIIRAFRQETTETTRFDAANDELVLVARSLGRLQVAMLPVITVVANLTAVAVVAIGAVLVDGGTLQIGQIAAAVGYLQQILAGIALLTVIAAILPRAATSAQRIDEVLTTEPAVADSGHRALPTFAPTSDQPGPELRLTNISLRRPGATGEILAGVSLRCPPGSTTALVGGTGSGKSTLLSLLPRLLDADSGGITWNGSDLRELSLTELRSRIGYVPQSGALLAGTVAANLRLGAPHADDTELWEALHAAEAAEFVRTLPGGLAGPVAQGGRNLSGGQRQRLALARALLRRPALYVLDEPFSALDGGTEQSIIATLTARDPRATVVLASQRISSIRHAGTIAVLDAGRISAVGDAHSLPGDSPIYRELAEAQELTEFTGAVAGG